MEPIIEIKGVGKKYRLNQSRGGYVALRDVLTNIAKRPLSFFKHKAKQAVGRANASEFWALKNVSATIGRGEVVGVIGSNGAGKSTLLKILTGITPPTEGEVIMRGRVASLLEVGTGFHPELSGRENIFLNGAILGMTKKEIARKFDEIVAFAGIETFLDTPVKYYSSGMYVRLAFSVAAHMEPDILLVDEVLAVGDAEFQKKCLGKMEEVTRAEGRTILFVSHNLGAIKNLCKKTIYLKKGRVQMIGDTDEVLRTYLGGGSLEQDVPEFREDLNRPAQIKRAILMSEAGDTVPRFAIDKPFFLEIDLVVHKPIRNATISASFYSEGELLLLSSASDAAQALASYEPGTIRTRIEVPPYLFNTGSYFVSLNVHAPFVESFDQRENIPFEVVDGEQKRVLVTDAAKTGKIATCLTYRTETL